MNVCTLGPEYEKKDDDEKATDELLCTKINADAAVYCAKIHAECGKALSKQ